MEDSRDTLANDLFLDRRKFMRKLRREIKNLEFQINHENICNFKNNTIKNLKITGNCLRLAAPFVLSIGIVISGFAILLNDVMFRFDDTKDFMKIEKSFDNRGNIAIYEQYKPFEHSNQLFSYSKWQDMGTGFFERTIRTYQIPHWTYEELINLIYQDNLDLESVFGNPVDIRYERRNNLSKEELQEEAFINVLIYDTDKNQVVVRKQTASENYSLTVMQILIIILLEIFATIWRDKSSYDFKKELKKIKKRYQDINVDDLQLKLFIKKNNYSNLTR